MKIMKYLFFAIAILAFLSCTNSKSNPSHNNIFEEEYEVEVECDNCDGRGYYISSCNACGGDGTFTRTTTSYSDAPATCSTCYGKGTVTRGSNVCSYCSGAGYKTCLSCKGSGIVYFDDYYECPSCKATGREMCYSCYGSGKRDNQYTCEDCWGTGKSGRKKTSYSYDQKVTCSSCNGKGRFRHTCNHCDGEGKIKEIRRR